MVCVLCSGTDPGCAPGAASVAPGRSGRPGREAARVARWAVRGWGARDADVFDCVLCHVENRVTGLFYFLWLKRQAISAR